MPGEWVFLTIFLVPMASGGTTAPSLSASPVVFARKFFRAITEEPGPQVNVLVSPAAARSAMTLVFMGAAGKSAEELRSNLILGAAKKTEIAKQHAEFWSKECTCAERGVALRLVTRLYVSEEEVLRPDFNVTAMEFFNAQADAVDLLHPDAAVNKVNKWLEKQTFYTVKNLLKPSSLSPKTSVVLVNSLFFRAKWAKSFPLENTSPEDFWINLRQRMELPMMRQTGHFRYGESKRLKAQILQLPFEDSNLTMMIILPNEIDGLAEMEEKLGELDMNEVAARSKMQDVEVSFPKFRIEGEMDLKVPLTKMGISRVFSSSQADLSNLFANRKPQSISEARHKLYLLVNEAGCETAPEPDTHIHKTKNNPDRKIFRADRPFVFAIRNFKAVYLVGHFMKP
ncbi:serine protease inhibitor 42Dd [Drosophila ananassae]|nr:serine protease inhibitor 42Dd [Drosophila ananassae]